VQGRDARHFPQSPTGMYAGHHPADGAEAVGDLNRLADGGARYLAIPATAAWWLDHYPELRERLDREGALVASDADTGLVYALTRQGQAERLTLDQLEAARAAPQAGGLVAALLPPDASVVVVGRSSEAVDVGARPCWRVPAPGEYGGADQIAARVEQAVQEGARYLVLVEDDDPKRRFDRRLRARIVASMRPVFRQRLAEAFEVPEPAAVG
jgi:hypothetical protein